MNTLKIRKLFGRTRWDKLRGPTKLKLDDIKGILYGGTSVSFELEKKSMMAKLQKRRKFERNLVSHFDGRLEKFDRLQGYEHLEDEGTEGQEEDE